MTNFGFHQAMAARGIEVATTPVGDRYVLEALRERAWRLGGEQSGHIIDMAFVPSGDGIAAALLAMEALGRRRPARAPRDGEAPADPGQRAACATRRSRMPTPSTPRSASEAASLEGRGRVLLRPSGTEPLVRVMVEAPSADEADSVCRRLVAALEDAR